MTNAILNLNYRANCKYNTITAHVPTCKDENKVEMFNRPKNTKNSPFCVPIN